MNCLLSIRWIVIVFVFALLSIGIINGPDATAQSDPVYIVLLPANTTVAAGSTFDITVQVQAGNNSIVAAAAYIDFDPAVLAVESVQPSSAFPQILQNEFFNVGASAGQVNFAAGTLSGTQPTGNFTLLEIRFRALTATDGNGTTLSFATTQRRKTDAIVGIESALSGTTPATIFVHEGYSLTTSIVGSGSVAPDGGIYAAGTVVEIAATPAPGWSFAGWSGDLNGMERSLDLTMDGDKSVIATFTQEPVPTYNLTVDVVGNGSVTPSSGTYPAGTVVSLTATSDAGWSFAGWSGDLSSTSNPATVTMDGNKNVTATFAENPSVQYTINASAGPNGSITPSGAVVVMEGVDQSFTITPDSGYQIADVLVDGSSVGAVSAYQFTNVQADHTIAASFTEQTALPATLTITKTVVGDPPETDWQFSGSGDIGDFVLPANGGSQTFTIEIGTIETGVYTVTETTRDGYVTTVECTNGTMVAGNSVAVSLTPGLHLGCTFTNTLETLEIFFVEGTLLDVQGNALAGASVVLNDTVQAAGVTSPVFEASEISEANGNFRIEGVPVGEYTLTVTLAGETAPVHQETLTVTDNLSLGEIVISTGGGTSGVILYIPVIQR